jgi:hypothetical protein
MAALNIFGYALLWHVQKPAPVIVTLGMIYTVFIGLGYVVLWFYWRGKNWARILVLLTSLLALLNLRSLATANIIVKVMIVGEALIAAFLLYWLNTAEAKRYFNPAANQRQMAKNPDTTPNIKTGIG